MTLRSATGIGGLVLLALVWGTQYLIIRIGQETLPALLSAALRFAILAVVGQMVIFLRRPRPPSGRLGSRLSMGAAHAFSMGLLYWAQSTVPSALAAIIIMTEPFFVTLLAHRFVPGESLRARVLFAHALGFGGLCLLLFGEQVAGITGVGPMWFALLLAAACGAVNKVIAKRLTEQIDPFVLIRDVGSVVFLVTAVGWLIFESDQPVHFTGRAIAAFVYLGAVASAAASALFLLLLRRYRVSSMAYLQFTTALVGVATGVWIGQETLGLTGGLGAVAILAGLALLARQPSRLPADGREQGVGHGG